MGWKEDRLDWLRRIIAMKEKEIGRHLVEIESLEEEIIKEKELNGENKELKNIIKILEEKRREGDI